MTYRESHTLVKKLRDGPWKILSDNCKIELNEKFVGIFGNSLTILSGNFDDEVHHRISHP